MNLILHAPDEVCNLPESYRRALSSAKELLIVSAYLTNWDKSVELNPGCERFRMIVGKDFGITRKAACGAVLVWIPPQHKVHFRVADQISGFHPKAVFWQEPDGNSYAIVGSSNLSIAAFESNYEANVAIPISSEDFDRARTWVDKIAALSVPVSEDWLKNYRESAAQGGGGNHANQKVGTPEVLPIKLPRPRGSASDVRVRREALKEYRRNRKGLIRHFRACAAGEVSPADFYAELPEHWSVEVGSRLQGKGWERRGSGSDFRKLAQSYVRILDASVSKRDDIVVAEIDQLARDRIPTRKAFLSEMLCLEFPDRYPVLNQPVQRYLSDVKFRGARGMSEGARYLDLALRLRLSLAQNPNHPAKNLAELDTVICRAYPPPPRN